MVPPRRILKSFVVLSLICNYMELNFLIHFYFSATFNSTEVPQLGCISRNLCTLHSFLGPSFSENISITCGAPWSIRVSSMLLTFALSALKFLL